MYKVVIAEDELFVRLGVKMSVDWEKLDMEIVADVENGQQALQTWEKLKPDIIITDIKMPLMNGISLIREIRKKDTRTRFIILSCLEEFEIVRDALSMGVSDYILKLTMTQDDMMKVLLKVKKELEILDGGFRNQKYHEEKKQFEDELRAWMYYRLDMSEKRRCMFKEQFKEGGVRIILLEIDNYQECKRLFNDSYGSMLEFAIGNILFELLQGKPHVLLNEKEGRSVLILQEKKGNIGLLEDTRKLLENIREVLGRYLKTGVSFGISSFGVGYQDLNRLYYESEQAINKKFFTGSGRNLFYRGQEQDECRILITRKMGRLIRNTRDEEEISRLKGVEEAFCKHENPVSIRQYFEHAISGQIGKILLNIQQRYQITESYTRRIKQSETMDEIIKVYQEVQEFLRSDGEKKQEHLSKPVKDILRYIREHYTEDITLDRLAEYVELSRTYVSGLFKKETGMNLTNYITNYRIEKAKELLRDTNLKSYEVAEKVGFLDESYFSRSFKKITGESPNSFKKGVRDI